MHPFRLLKESELAALRTEATSALERWQGGWIAGGENKPMATISPWDSKAAYQEKRWWPVHEDGVVVAYMTLAEWSYWPFVRVLLGVDLDEPIEAKQVAVPVVEKFVNLAVTGFVAEYMKDPGNKSITLGASCVDLPAALLKPGSGAALLALSLGTVTAIICIVTGTVARMLQQQDSPQDLSVRASRQLLTRRHEAIDNEKVRLDVLLEEDNLRLGDIPGLRVGDVIMFDHGISSPVTVVVHNGPKLGKCFLGMKQGFMGIKLVDQAVNT